MRKLVMTALIASGLMISCDQQPATESAENKTEALGDGIYAKMETTLGDIIIKLDEQKSPITVANFVALTEGNMPFVSDQYKDKPYFDGLTFHRVIPGFMIQGGDPAANGQGGPGYQFPDETDNGLTHNKGVISMANAGPGTNGSQFFITVAPTQQLDGRHTVFGKVVSGQNVADSISKVPTGAKGKDVPNTTMVMNKVTIIRNGEAAQNFDAPAVFKAEQEKQQAKAEQVAMEAMKTIDSLSIGYDVKESGLRIKITEKGKGKVKPQTGETVVVHYTGRLINGTKFDSSVDRGQPFQFIIGIGQVIKGWDQGISLLNIGDKASLVIPPDLAYGSRGGGPIPPNSWLLFDVELVDVKKTPTK